MASKSVSVLNSIVGNATVQSMDGLTEYLSTNYDIIPHPDYQGFDGETWFYDEATDTEICITDKFLDYCSENNLVDYSGENKGEYSLTDLFDYYHKLPNELKESISTFDLSTKGMNQYNGKYRGSDNSLTLNPNAFNQKDDSLNPYMIMTHEFIHAHDDNYSDEWQISGNNNWKQVVDKYPPLTDYSSQVLDEEGGRNSTFYSESLAEAGSMYVTSKINKDYAISYTPNEEKIDDSKFKEKYPSVWKELDNIYGNMFK